jgi:hypothetical protein
VQGEVLPDAVGRPSLGSSLLSDPGAKFSAENEEQAQKEKKWIVAPKRSWREIFCGKRGTGTKREEMDRRS